MVLLYFVIFQCTISFETISRCHVILDVELLVLLTFLWNFFQRNYYIFCGQIDKVYLYVFQRRFRIFWNQKLQLVALHTLKHSRF